MNKDKSFPYHQLFRYFPWKIKLEKCYGINSHMTTSTFQDSKKEIRGGVRGVCWCQHSADTDTDYWLQNQWGTTVMHYSAKELTPMFNRADTGSCLGWLCPWKKYADQKQKVTANLRRNPLEENQECLWDQVGEARSNTNILQYPKRLSRKRTLE
jgi:hypothetical protein